MVADWVRQIVEDEMGNSLQIGKTYVHPTDGPITITSGRFWSNGRVSNFWTWTTQSGEEKHGYGGDWPLTTDQQ